MSIDPTATLAAIRERHASTYGSSPERWWGTQRDVPRLLAAITAVLELADDWDAPAGYLNDDMSDPNAQARDCAQDLREAITAALAGTGKDASDGA